MNRKNWLKRIGSIMLALCLVLGLVAEWVPMIGQASSGYTELAFKDFGITAGAHTGEVKSNKTPISSFDGVAITQELKFETDVNLSPADGTYIRIGAEGYWVAPISLQIAEGSLYAANCINAMEGVKIKDNVALDTPFTLRMEFNYEGNDVKAKYYVDDMTAPAVEYTYVGYANSFKPYILLYGANGKKVTTYDQKKEYKEYTFADYGITAGEYTGQTDNTTTPSETTLDGVAITETLKLSADRDAYIRFAGVTAYGWESPIDLYHADGVLYCYDHTPGGEAKHDMQLHTSLVAGTEFKLRMEFDYVGADVVVKFYINDMDTPLNVHTYEGYATKFTHKIIMNATNGAKINVGKKQADPTPESYGYTKVTLKDDFGFDDGIYKKGQVAGDHRVSTKTVDLNNKYVYMKVAFNSAADATSMIFASENGWGGIKVAVVNSELYILDATVGYGNALHFDAAALGLTSIKEQVNLKLGFELGSYSGSTCSSIKVTAWSGDKYLGNLTFQNVANSGQYVGIYTAENNATLTLGEANDPGDEPGGNEPPKTYTTMTFADFGFAEGVYTGENIGTKHATLTSLDGIAIEDDITFEKASDGVAIRFGGVDAWHAPIHLFINTDGFLYAWDSTEGGTHGCKLVQMAANTKFKFRMEFDVTGEDVKITYYVNGNLILDHVYPGYVSKISPQMLVHGASGKVIIGEPYIDPFTVHSFAAFGFPAGEYTGNTLGDKATTPAALWDQAIVEDLILEEEEKSRIRIGSEAYDKGYIVLYIKNGKLYVNDESGVSSARGPKNVELASVAAGEKFKLRIEFKMGANVRQTVVSFYVNDMRNAVYTHNYVAQKTTILPQICINGGSEGKKVIVGTPGQGGGNEGGGNEGGEEEPVGPETYNVVSFADFGFEEGHYTGENRNTKTPEGMENFSNMAIVDTVTFEEAVATRIGIGAEADNIWKSPITLYLDQGKLYARDHMDEGSGHWFSIKAMMPKMKFKLRVEFDYSGDDVTVKFYVDKMATPAVTREYKGYASKIKPTIFVYGSDNKHVSIGNPEPIPDWPTTFTELTLEDFGYKEDVYTGENYGVPAEGITNFDGVAIEDTIKFEDDTGETSIRIGNPGGWEGYLSLYIDNDKDEPGKKALYARNYADPASPVTFLKLVQMNKDEKFKFRFEFDAFGENQLRVRYYINDMTKPVAERTYNDYADKFVPKVMLYGGKGKYVFVRDAKIPEITYTEMTFEDFGIEDGMYISDYQNTNKNLDSMDRIFLTGTITLGGYVGQSDVRIGAGDYWLAPIQLYISNDPVTGQDRLWAWDSYATSLDMPNRGLSICPMKPGEKFKIGMKFLYKDDDVIITYYIDDMENPIASYRYVGYAKDDIFKPNMLVYATGGKTTLIGDVDTTWPTEFNEKTFEDFGIEDGLYVGQEVGTPKDLKSLNKVALTGTITFGDLAEKAQIRIGGTDEGGWLAPIQLFITPEEKTTMLYAWDAVSTDKSRPGTRIKEIKPGEKFKIRMEFFYNGDDVMVMYYINDMENAVTAYTYYGYAKDEKFAPKILVYNTGGSITVIGDKTVDTSWPTKFKEMTFKDFGFPEGVYTGENQGKQLNLKSMDGVAIQDTIAFEDGASQTSIRFGHPNGWEGYISFYLDQGMLYARDFGNPASGNWFALKAMKPNQKFKLRMEFDVVENHLRVRFYVDDMKTAVTDWIYQDYAKTVVPKVMIYGGGGYSVMLGKAEVEPWPTKFKELTFADFGFPEGVYTGENQGKQLSFKTMDGVAIQDTIAFEDGTSQTSIRIGNPNGWEGYVSLFLDTNPADGKTWLYVRDFGNPASGNYFAVKAINAGQKFKLRMEFDVVGNDLRARYYVDDMSIPAAQWMYKGYANTIIPKVMVYGGGGYSVMFGKAEVQPWPEKFTELTFADFGFPEGVYTGENQGEQLKYKTMDNIAIEDVIAFEDGTSQTSIRIGNPNGWEGYVSLFLDKNPMDEKTWLYVRDFGNPTSGNYFAVKAIEAGQKFRIRMEFDAVGNDLRAKFYVNDMSVPAAQWMYKGYAKTIIPKAMVYGGGGYSVMFGKAEVQPWPEKFTELTFADFGFPEGVYTGENQGKQLKYKTMDNIAIEDTIAFEDGTSQTSIRIGNPNGWEGYVSLFLDKNPMDEKTWLYVRDFGNPTSGNYFAVKAVEAGQKFRLRMEFDVVGNDLRSKFYVDDVSVPAAQWMYKGYAKTVVPKVMIYGGSAKSVLIGNAKLEKINYKTLSFADFGIKAGEYTSRVTGTPLDSKIKTLNEIAIEETITFSSPSVSIRIGAKDEEGWIAPIDLMVADDGWLYTWNEIDRTVNSAKLAEIAAYEQFRIRTEFNYNGDDVIVTFYINDMTIPVSAMNFRGYADKIAPRVMVYGSDGNALLIGKGKLEKPAPIVQASPEELGYEQISLPQFGVKGGVIQKGANEDYNHRYGSFQEGNSVSGKYLDINVAFKGKDLNAGETSIRYASADGWRGISIGVEGGSLRVFNASVGGGYTFSLEQLGLKSFDETFNLKLGVKTGKKYNVGTPTEAQDLTFCLWVNDKLIAKDAKLSQVEAVGDGIGIYVAKNILEINAPKGMRGVDFRLFGFTNKWEKELGIK